MVVRQPSEREAKSYAHVWADGVYLQARLEDEAQCILVIIGATPEGRKELLGFADGARESAHDWRALLLDLKRRGPSITPKIAVADGALGFWKAIGEVWPKAREQRCWVHKTANVLNKLPKSQQPKAKRRDASRTGRRSPRCSSWSLPEIIQGVKFTDGCEVIAKRDDVQTQIVAACDSAGRSRV